MCATNLWDSSSNERFRHVWAIHRKGAAPQLRLTHARAVLIARSVSVVLREPPSERVEMDGLTRCCARRGAATKAATKAAAQAVTKAATKAAATDARVD